MKYPYECFESAALNEKYYKIAHTSGLTVFVYPKALSTAYVMFSTRYGSLERTFRTDDGAFVTVPDGVAHFLEHKLFEEEDGSDAFAKFAPLGASANAFTSHEMTSYLFSTTDRVEDALAVLLDFVTHPFFTDDNVKKEQGIIAQEIGMCEDDPNNRLYYALMKSLFCNHNVKIDIAGTVDSISEITPATLYKCYNTFYSLSNMVLTVCGDITPETVMDVVARVLPEKEEHERIECAYPEEPTAVASTRCDLSMSVATPLFALGIKDLKTFSSPDEKVRYGTLAEMLGKCFFSRSAEFYNEIYDAKLIVKDIGYSFDMLANCSYLMISGESESPDTLYQRTTDLLKNISSNLPSEETFLRIKRVMYANYIRNFDSTESIAFSLTEHHMAGSELYAVGDIITSITYEEFVRFACSFFDGKEFSFVIIHPCDKEIQ